MYLEFMIHIIMMRNVKNAMEPFVVGGVTATITDFPHSVFLSIVSNDSAFMCGGSILNQNMILTAAHCLEEFTAIDNNNYVEIKSGHHDLSLMDKTRMKDFKMHEHYNGVFMRNDICLVVPEVPFEFGTRVRRVAIFNSISPTLRIGYTAGWGVINRKEATSHVLLSALQRLQPNKICKLVGDIPNGTFCAGPILGPGAPNQGDSGSALVIRKYMQLGLVSYKVPKYTLVVYTNVSYHYKWVVRTAKALHCKHKYRVIPDIKKISFI